MSQGSIKNRIQQNNTELTNVITTVEALPDYLDTTDANATASDIAENKTAYVNGVKITRFSCRYWYGKRFCTNNRTCNKTRYLAKLQWNFRKSSS